MPKDTVLRIKVNPNVGHKQRVSLILNEFLPQGQPKSYNITAPARDKDTDTIEIPVDIVASGNYLVRIQVDGAESTLGVDNNPDSATYEHYIEPLVEFQ